MVFNGLKFDSLVDIYRLLEPRDRLTCAEVCREWNEAFSAFKFFTEDFMLKIDSRNASEIPNTVKVSRRDHRTFAVDLTDGPDMVIQYFKQVAHRSRYLLLFGDSAPTLSCLESISFYSLTELRLEIHSSGFQQEPPTSPLDVFMPTLKTFHYLQFYGPHPKTVILRLIAPNLEKATVHLDATMPWEDPIVEIVQCSKLIELDVDLKGHFWDEFFAQERPHLERLVLHHHSEARNWDNVFHNMPNLRFVELKTLEIAMLDSLGKNCPRIEWLKCESFFVATESINADVLKPLPVPMLTRLMVRECDFRSLKLQAGNRLESMDLECFEDRCREIRSFFQSLENLRELTLHMNREASGLIGALGTLPNLRRLKIAFETVSDEDDCSRLIGDIGANCPLLEQFLFSNSNGFQLKLSSECFGRLSELKYLKDFQLADVTVVDERQPIPVEVPMDLD